MCHHVFTVGEGTLDIRMRKVEGRQVLGVRQELLSEPA